MEVKIEIPYEQLLKAILALPQEQKKRLRQDLEKELAAETVENAPSHMQALLLQAPTWTEQEYQEYLSGREHLNQFRNP